MFTWIPIYKEIVGKIKGLPGDHETRGKSLLRVIKQISKEGVDTIKTDLPVDLIDPFTFFTNFNRSRINKEKRCGFLKSLKRIWKLQENIPDDFAGIPVLRPDNIYFFEKDEDLKYLWQLFDLICAASREDFSLELSQAFDKCLEIKGIAITKLTIGLFWIRPDLFIPLDKNIKAMLKLSDNDAKSMSFYGYKQILNEVRRKFPDKKFWEVSYEAWKKSNINYWCANFGDERKLNYGLENNLWLMQYQYGEQEKKLVTQHWNLVKEVKEGDWIVAYVGGRYAKGKSRFYAIGKVIKPREKANHFDAIERTVKERRHEYTQGIVHYKDAEAFYENFNETFEGGFSQRIDIEKWEFLVPEGVSTEGLVEAVEKGILQKSIFGIKKEFFEKIKRRLKEKYMERKENQIEELLSKSHQIIFYGPPGTGKTYLAKKVAAKLLGLPPEAGVDKNHSQYGEFENAQFGKNGKSNTKGKWAIVQFHPSYNYEDFVRGIKITTKGKGISYESVDKIFAKMCKEALQNNEENYVLIIDEINRANLAAVLGELIYALEYRGETVNTLYEVKGNSKLTVPPNLYIIGTMNTADRSIGHIDYAVRRRFAFVQVLPEENVIEQHYDNEEVKKVALKLFNSVRELFDEENGYLSPDYYKEDVQVGHSYFLVDTSKNVEEQVDELAYKFAYQVFPLLKEYYKDGVLVPKNGEIRLNGLDISITEPVKSEEIVKKIESLYSPKKPESSEEDKEE